MSRLIKHLIIVGNKPASKVKSMSTIDSYDYVIRINNMNSAGMIGSKTNGLYVEFNEHFRTAVSPHDFKIKITSVEKIFMREKYYLPFFKMQKYLSREQYESIELIDESIAIEYTKCERLTSTIKLIGYIANSNWSLGYKICVTCLDIWNRGFMIDHHPTWWFHAGVGAQEEEYLLSLIKGKQIFVIK